VTTSPSGPSSGPSSVSPLPAPSNSQTGGSEVYEIAPDGQPHRIFSSQDIVYALEFDNDGRLLAGTGNRGHIFVIGKNDDFTDLVKTSASQITGFARARDGALYVATSNLGKIYLMGARPDEDGSYDSDIFDAHIFSKWGRAEVRGFGLVDFYARSGNVDNPDRNWSPWTKVDLQRDTALDVPPARFIQWRAVLHPGAQPATIEDVAVNYRPDNVAPEIDDIAVQVGSRYPQILKASVPDSSGGPPQSSDQPSPVALHDRDSIALRWNAHDDNNDQLILAIYYRGDGESQWKLLKDKITDRFYSWDAGLLPDGGYTVKVVASDAPSHTPDEALSSERESTRFEVDHTPPTVADLVARSESGEIHVTFRGMDNFSPIKRAEYSIDAGDWQFVEPIGQLSDSKVENYDFAVPSPRATLTADAPPVVPTTRGGDHGASATRNAVEHVIVVRVYDRYDNMGTAKAIFRAP
jgi:hypothetical protein